MKNLLLIILVISSFDSKAQSYDLIPDSCTYCFFFSSTGGNSWFLSRYDIYPSQDTIIGGNTYAQVKEGWAWFTMGIRQVGNKMYGIPRDSTNEELIMDFDVSVNDTLYNLFSNGYYYHAVVDSVDSTLLSDGTYHNWINLTGYKIYYDGQWNDPQLGNWMFKWSEKGLCNSQGWADVLGGVMYNIPINQFGISILYTAPSYCTSDTLFTNPGGNNCTNCDPVWSNLNNAQLNKLSLFPNPTDNLLNIHFKTNFNGEIKIFSLLGKEVLSKKINATEIQLKISHLPSGMYSLILIDEYGAMTQKKIIKN